MLWKIQMSVLRMLPGGSSNVESTCRAKVTVPPALPVGAVVAAVVGEAVVGEPPVLAVVAVGVTLALIVTPAVVVVGWPAAEPVVEVALSLLPPQAARMAEATGKLRPSSPARLTTARRLSGWLSGWAGGNLIRCQSRWASSPDHAHETPRMRASDCAGRTGDAPQPHARTGARNGAGPSPET